MTPVSEPTPASRKGICSQLRSSSRRPPFTAVLRQAAHVSLAEVQLEHVVAVMKQADRLGRQEFARLNGFGFATSYLLRHGGRFYDPKAVVGVAHGVIDGHEPLRAEE